jgi:anaerobic selenocysteine-containing dehydrogenase
VQASDDVAFLHGVLKHMINEKWLNDEFVRRHTAGFEELRQMLEQISWEELETGSGVTRDGMREFARIWWPNPSVRFLFGEWGLPNTLAARTTYTQSLTWRWRGDLSDVKAAV